MKNTLILCIFVLLLCNQLYSQDIFAVINDSDSYTNVHEGNIQSKIVEKIPKYQPFECFEKEDAIGDKQYSKMISIQYTNYVSKKGENYSSNTEDQNKPFEGYIYKNRVYRLSDMPKLKYISENENKVIYGNSSLKIEIETAKFDAKKHIIKNAKGRLVKTQSGYSGATTIDGLQIWGTDGNIPSKEIKSIKIIYQDTLLVLCPSSIKNIFEPTIEPEHTQISIGADNEIYIWLQNSDGAASYNVIWVIVNKKLLYRFTRLSFYV